MAKPKSPKTILAISGILVAITVACYFLVPPFQNFVNEAFNVLTSNDRERVENWVSQYGAWGPVIIIVAMTLQMFLIVAPSWILMVIAILAYGQIWGVVISIVAVMVASTIGYWIGMALSCATLDRLIGEKKVERIDQEVERYGLWAVVIARLNPLLSNDAISFVAGLFRLGFLKYLIATLAGIAPLSVLIGIFGESTSSMKWGLGIISGVSLVGLALKIYLDKRREKKEERGSEERAAQPSS